MLRTGLRCKQSSRRKSPSALDGRTLSRLSGSSGRPDADVYRSRLSDREEQADHSGNQASRFVGSPMFQLLDSPGLRR